MTTITKTHNMGNHVTKDYYYAKDCDAPSKLTPVTPYGTDEWMDDDFSALSHACLQECMMEQDACQTNDAFEVL
jgi:hypothetical protein